MEDNKSKYMEGVGWRCDTDTDRHHRESLWDYKGRAIYHITLATEGRQPIFGTLTGNSAEEAFVVYSRLGEYVDRTLRGLPAFFARKGARIKVIAVRVMPKSSACGDSGAGADGKGYRGGGAQLQECVYIVV